MVSSARALVIEEATIADLHAAYRAGTLTVHAVTAACLARIAAYDKNGPYINALITVNAHALGYVNRLSDLLFVLARWIAKHQGEEEFLWERGLRLPTKRAAKKA